MLVDIQPYQMANNMVSQIRPVTMKSVLIIGVKGKALHQEKPDGNGYKTSYLVDGKTYDSSEFFDSVGPTLDVIEDFSASEVWVGRKIIDTVPVEKAFFGFSIASSMKLPDLDIPKIATEVTILLSHYGIFQDLRIASVLAGSVAE